MTLNGNIVSLQTKKAYLQERLPCQLLSPQAFLKHSSQKLNGHFQIYSDNAELHQDGSTVLTLPFNSSFLPSLTLFRHGSAQALLNALYNTLVGDSNANLSPWTKHWLHWHYRLGHLGFEHMRQLGVGGYLLVDTKALGLTKTELLNPPKCAAPVATMENKQESPTTLTPKHNTHLPKDSCLRDSSSQVNVSSLTN
jgi:hypothetical protein